MTEWDIWCQMQVNEKKRNVCTLVELQTYQIPYNWPGYLTYGNQKGAVYVKFARFGFETVFSEGGESLFTTSLVTLVIFVFFNVYLFKTLFFLFNSFL